VMPSTTVMWPPSTTGVRTTYAWWHQLDEQPHPDPLPGREWAALSVRPMLGLAALEVLIAAGVDVGPVLVCMQHRWLHIPVEPEAVRSFLGERLGVKGRCLSCAYDGQRLQRGGCRPFRLWLLPQDPTVLTDFRALAERLDAMRAMRAGPVSAVA